MQADGFGAELPHRQIEVQALGQFAFFLFRPVTIDLAIQREKPIHRSIFIEGHQLGLEDPQRSLQRQRPIQRCTFDLAIFKKSQRASAFLLALS
jgi:hypothetical protein